MLSIAGKSRAFELSGTLFLLVFAAVVGRVVITVHDNNSELDLNDAKQAVVMARVSQIVGVREIIKTHYVSHSLGLSPHITIFSHSLYSIYDCLTQGYLWRTIPVAELDVLSRGQALSPPGHTDGQSA